VCERGGRLRIGTDVFDVSALGIINATGTWDRPYIPEYPGAERFKGRQRHMKDYHTADKFRGKHVVTVGGGSSAFSCSMRSRA